MAIKAPRNVPTVIEIYGRQLIIWEDIDNKFIRACLAEFLAMHLFVLLCCGCAMVTLNLPNPNLMMVAASFGFGILTLAQIFGPLSGGHINSAVSLGLFVAGRTSLIKTICYTLSQMLGSVFGALFLWAIFGNNWPAARAFGSNSFDEAVFTGGQVFFAEMLGTMLLVFNVLSTIDIPQEGGGPLGVYPIAMSVMVAHLFLIPIDGCSINPTRSFGPSLVAQWANIQGTYYHQQPVFWFGPMFGAVVAAFFYEYGTLKPENFAGAKDMDTAIFQAGKKRKVGKHGKRASATKAAAHEGDVEDPAYDTVPISGSSSSSSAPAPVSQQQQLYYSKNTGAIVSASRPPAGGEYEMVSNPMIQSSSSTTPSRGGLLNPPATTASTSSVPSGGASSAGASTLRAPSPASYTYTHAAPASTTTATSNSPPAAPKSAPPSTLPDIPTVPTKPNKGKNKSAKNTPPAPAPAPAPVTTESSNAGFEDFDEEDLM